MIESPDQILQNINYLVYDKNSSYTRYLFFVKKGIILQGSNQKKNKTLPKGWWMLNLSKKVFDKKYLIKILKLSTLGFLPEIRIYGENYIISKFLNKYNSLDELQKKRYYLYSENKNLIYENVLQTLNKWHLIGYGHNNIKSSNILIGPEYEILLIHPSKTNNFSEDIEQVQKIFM